MQWMLYSSLNILQCNDLVSMVVNNKESMEIIRLTYLEIDSTVMEFHVYQNNWEPMIGEVLKTCMEPQNKVDKYAVAVVIRRTMLLVIYQKGKVENM